MDNLKLFLVSQFFEQTSQQPSFQPTQNDSFHQAAIKNAPSSNSPVLVTHITTHPIIQSCSFWLAFILKFHSNPKLK